MLTFLQLRRLNSLRITGSALAKRHQIEAKQSLYRADGRWYHLLKVFPGVLFDSEGYVRFRTAQEYENCVQIKRYEQKDQAIIQHGIAKIPGYQLLAQSSAPQGGRCR